MKLATSSGVGRATGELRAALSKGIARLEECGVPSAPLAAELLLMHVLRRDRAWLYAHPEYELRLEETAAYAEVVERRSQGAPTQYLTGRQEFWGLEFEVGPGVLIPRPETEHVIEVALERLGPRRSQTLRVADVGTGSGCIAIALAHELPQAEIVATDVSRAGSRLCAEKCRATLSVGSYPVLRGKFADSLRRRSRVGAEPIRFDCQQSAVRRPQRCPGFAARGARA